MITFNGRTLWPWWVVALFIMFFMGGIAACGYLPLWAAMLIVGLGLCVDHFGRLKKPAPPVKDSPGREV